MDKNSTLRELEKLGTAQNRKVYARHGVRGEMFGVSYANYGKLAKRLKTDHELALALWGTRNHDARILAMMIADPVQVTLQWLEANSRELDNYVVTDAFSGLARKSPHARKCMEKWMQAKGEWIATAGWNILTSLAMQTNALDKAFFEERLRVIEVEIHASKNRVRYAMNNALIAIGLRNSHLEKKAIAAAKRIGKVAVDHGETSCKTPDAVPYIQKALEQRRQKRKR